MKKLGIIILLIIIFSGCTGKLDEDQLIYNGYVEELKEMKKTNTTKKIVDVNIEWEEEKKEIAYRVVIDNPKVEMYNIEAIAYHSFKTDDIYPTIGVFDKKVNLISKPEKKNDANVKGIVLAGYIKKPKNMEQFHPTFKIMIFYNDKDNVRQKIYYTKKI